MLTPEGGAAPAECPHPADTTRPGAVPAPRPPAPHAASSRWLVLGMSRVGDGELGVTGRGAAGSGQNRGCKVDYVER